MKKYHKIEITPKIGGFLVSVWCGEILFCNYNSMLDFLAFYYRDPEVCEKTYRPEFFDKPEPLPPGCQVAPDDPPIWAGIPAYHEPTKAEMVEKEIYNRLIRGLYPRPMPDNGDKA